MQKSLKIIEALTPRISGSINKNILLPHLKRVTVSKLLQDERVRVATAKIVATASNAHSPDEKVPEDLATLCGSCFRAVLKDSLTCEDLDASVTASSVFRDLLTKLTFFAPTGRP